MTTDAATRTNYIFIDYENVQEIHLDLIAGKAVKVFLIVGQRQKSLPYVLSKQIHKYHNQVQPIDSPGTGRNALDMVLAYQIGLQVAADPQGYFHVLSKDKDYDALIKHLRDQDILASRDEEFSRIPALIAMSRFSLEERVQWVVERFQKNKASRPKRKKSLLTTIHALCRKEISEGDAEQILNRMVSRKLITFDAKGAVAYAI